MAVQSICARCGHPGFENVKGTPEFSKEPMLYVRCEKCGAVASIMPLADPNYRLERIENFLQQMASQLKVTLFKPS